MKSWYTIPHSWIPENLDFSRPPLRNEECWYWWIYAVGLYSRFSKSSPFIQFPMWLHHLSLFGQMMLILNLNFTLIHYSPHLLNKKGFQWCLNRKVMCKLNPNAFWMFANHSQKFRGYCSQRFGHFLKHNYPQGFDWVIFGICWPLISSGGVTAFLRGTSRCCLMQQ